MIFDNFKNIRMYFGSKLDIITEHAATINVDAPVGRINLQNSIYANIESYTTEVLENCRPEAHKLYCDVHLILHGNETIYCFPNHEMTIYKEYNSEKDIEFYSQNYSLEGSVVINLNQGNFAFLYPWDIHMPHVCFNKPQNIKKLVYKIPYSFFND